MQHLYAEELPDLTSVCLLSSTVSNLILFSVEQGYGGIGAECRKKSKDDATKMKPHPLFTCNTQTAILSFLIPPLRDVPVL